MKKNIFLSFLTALAFVSGCSHQPLNETGEQQQAVKVPTLVERVQSTITVEQKKVIDSLPDNIAGLIDENGVADYEKKHKGAGYSRTYEANGKMLTVFVGNNTEFGIEDGITPEAHATMENLLKELNDYQETGLYRHVKIDAVQEKEMTVSGKKYAFLRVTASFERQGERKVTYIALIPSKKLLSYLRIRLTYPMSFRATKLQNESLKAVMNAVADFE